MCGSPKKEKTRHSVRSNYSLRKVLQLLSHKVSAISPSVKLKIQPPWQLQELQSPAGNTLPHNLFFLTV